VTAASPATGPRARAAIRRLPPEVAARIAAGEVIERPASVVKELLENALDAGARRVEIAIAGGGVELVRVRDDGCGIPAAELADAFERHATSKLRRAEELFEVRTLGFRGEALAAIVAAAEVRCTTRPAGEHAAATARFRGGRLEHAGSAGAAPGTTVEARELFAELPARRRFLRSPRAEARAVAQLVTDYALARPDVAFRLEIDGRTALATDGGGDQREAWAAIYGDEAARALLALAHAREEPDGARVAVTGLAGPPSLHRASRGAIHLFANGRAIVSRQLVHAVEQAYAGLLPAARHPLAVLHVEVPPARVDVNVHPRKAEVRFRDDRLVHATVSEAVRRALAGAPAAGVERLLPPPPGGAASARLVLATARPAPPPIRSAAHGESAAARPPLPLDERLPALRALGQVDATYLVAEAPDGLYLVDQHAAHERVLYERVLGTLAARAPEAQPLLEAAVVALAPAQLALALAEREALAALGFELAETDGAALMLRAVPAALAQRDPARTLTEYLDRLDAEERLSGPDRAAATLACRAAVQAGDRLDAEQQRALLLALERCEQPQTCPHGRPTLLHLSREALGRSFGRI
jgi:DNA mismatch repair protein MutL